MISVLYVDDEPLLLELGKNFLEMTGDFKVDLQESAVAALVHLTTHTYDAIIADYQMPEMDGLEFLRQVRIQHGQVPFILFTGRGREEVVILAFNNGADYYLQKGGEPRPQFAELAHKIRLAVHRRQADEELKKSENLYRAIFDNTGAATIIIEKDTTITLANARFAAFSGYSIEELEGKRSWTEFVVKEDLERMKKYHYDRRNDPVTVPRIYDFRFIDRYGAIKYCINNVAMIPGTTRSVASVVDINDRVLAEQDYRSIFENIQDVFYRTDTKGNLVLASPSSANILDYASISELYGKNIADILYVNPEDRVKLLAEIEKNGSVSNYEVLLRKRDGTPMTILASSHKYYDAAGTFRGIEGILRDISDRKRVEDELKKSENLYRAIFDNTGAATIIIAPDTTILLANAGWEKLTGVPRADQEKKLSWTVFIDKDDVQRMKNYHYARRKDPSLVPTIYECRLIDARKEVHYCFVHVDMIPGIQNSVASLVDITERRKAEDKLRAAYEQLTAAEEELRAQYEELINSHQKIKESEENYRSIIENLQDAFYRTDLKGNLILVSPSFALELGYDSVDEVLGKNVADDLYFNPADRDLFLKKLAETGELNEYRVLIKRRDGSPLAISATSHIYHDEKNNPAGVEGMIRILKESGGTNRT